MCNLFYVYAFRANARIKHGMMCYCIDMEYMWYGESFIPNLLPSYYYVCEPCSSRFAYIILNKSRVPRKDKVGGTRGEG